VLGVCAICRQRAPSVAAAVVADVVRDIERYLAAA
jgi:hypothetical protein